MAQSLQIKGSLLTNQDFPWKVSEGFFFVKSQHPGREVVPLLPQRPIRRDERYGFSLGPI